MEATHGTKPLSHANNHHPQRAEEVARRNAKRPEVVLNTRVPLAFLAGSREGLAGLPTLLSTVTDAALSVRRHGPLPSGTPAQVLTALLAALGPAELPNEGMGSDAALSKVARTFAQYGLDLTHPRAAAHLQPPPLAVAVAADLLASATNASLDTYDSGPSGVALERWLIRVLTKLARLGPNSDGVLTPGGSLSNLLGLLLARDAAALRRGVDARRDGIGALRKPIVFCSELAHFSVHRACAALGLGESAVCALPTDARHRIDLDALRKVLRALRADQTPLAIIATAGTTDFGSIDPLSEIADLAAEHGIWLHVDAAYGFGALFSDRLASLLQGIERADSITLDLHKLGWQPAAASVLLVADAKAFVALDREVAYLNPSDDTAAGLDGLLGRSLQTTRRPDALKIVATLLAHGRRGLGEMVDHCHDLARHAAHCIASTPELELLAPAELTTVVFRYRLNTSRTDRARQEDELNGRLRRLLLESGTALIGRTTAIAGSDPRPRVCLKLTLLNPTTSPEQIEELIGAVLDAGRVCERQLEESAA